MEKVIFYLEWLPQPKAAFNILQSVNKTRMRRQSLQRVKTPEWAILEAAAAIYFLIP